MDTECFKSATGVLNDFVKNLETLLEEAGVKYQTCNEECKTLKTSLEAAKNENTVLKEALESTRNENRLSSEECNKLKAALETVEKDKISLTAALESTRNENRLSNEECKKLKASLNAANDKINKLEKECTTSELSFSEVANENATLKNSLSEVKNANVALTEKYNESQATINDIKIKLKLSSDIIKKLKKEKRAAIEDLSKVKEVVNGSACKPLIHSPTKSIDEVILSSDDEDDLSCIAKYPQSDEKVRVQKAILVEQSGKKVRNNTHERDEVCGRPSSPKKDNLSVSPRITSPATSSPNQRSKAATSAGTEGNRFTPASAVRTQNNRAIGAVSPRRDVWNFDRSPSPSISTSEKKSKITYSPTKGKEVNSPSSPVSVANSPSKINQAIAVVSLVSPKTNNQSLSKINQTVAVVSSSPPKHDNRSPVHSILTTTETQLKNKPVSPNSNEVSDRVPTAKEPNQTTKNITSPRNDAYGIRSSSVSTMLDTCVIRSGPISPMLEKQPIAITSSPKSNEVDNSSSPALNASLRQDRPNQAIAVLSARTDDRNYSECDPVSSISGSPKSQSTADSVLSEGTSLEKKNCSSTDPIIGSQSKPAAAPATPCSPTSNNESDVGDKEQNRDSALAIVISQINQNIVTPPLKKSKRRSISSINSPMFSPASKGRENISSSLPLSGNRASRASVLLSRAKDRGCQFEPSLRGNSECGSVSDSNCFIGWDKSNNECDKSNPQSDPIIKDTVSKENKEPAGGKELSPEELMSRHFSNLSESSSKTSASSGCSNFENISILDSGDDSNALPSSSEESVAIPERWFSSNELKFPLVYIPRIDQVTEEELYQEMKYSREDEKNKRTSTGEVVRPSKKRSSNFEQYAPPSKKCSQRKIKSKTYE